MILDAGPLLRGEVKRIDIDYMLSPEPLDGVVFQADARVTGALTDRAGYMCLHLQASLPYVGACARCLCDVKGEFVLDFERTVVAEGTLSEEQLDEHFDEYAVLDGCELNVDEQLLEELILGFPTKLLCEDDCQGLCPKCGKPRREGDCGCPTKEIDPRWAVLKTFFDEEEKK